MNKDLKKAIEEYAKDYAEWWNHWHNSNSYRPSKDDIKKSNIELFLEIDEEDDPNCSISFVDYNKHLNQTCLICDHFDLEELEKIYSITPSRIDILIRSNDMDFMNDFFDYFGDLFYINTGSNGLFRLENEKYDERFSFDNFKDFYTKFESLKLKLTLENF